MDATLKDIAEKAGVSVATVSRFLNKNGYVSREAGLCIEKALTELSYQPKKYKARSKRHSGNNEIGVIIAEQSMFFSDIADAVQDVAALNGKVVFMSNSQEQREIELKNIEAMYRHVGGIIITPISQIHSYNEEFLIEINKNGIPVILVDRDISSGRMDGVFTDSYQGAYDGVMALIAEGHTKIGLLAGNTASKPGLDRLNGYLCALRDSNIEINEEFILYGDFSCEKTYIAVKRLLTKGLPMTALFSSNYQMTIGCLRAFDEYDILIPRDISFISFDDYPMFGTNMYKMSVVVNPGYQVGEEAAKILFSRLSDIKKGRTSYIRNIALTPYLKLRGSEKFVCDAR